MLLIHLSFAPYKNVCIRLCAQTTLNTLEYFYFINMCRPLSLVLWALSFSSTSFPKPEL